jgi:hypothetical protein
MKQLKAYIIVFIVGMLLMKSLDWVTHEDYVKPNHEELPIDLKEKEYVLTRVFPELKGTLITYDVEKFSESIDTVKRGFFPFKESFKGEETVKYRAIKNK